MSRSVVGMPPPIYAIVCRAERITQKRRVCKRLQRRVSDPGAAAWLTVASLALALCFGAGLAQAPRPASWSAASHGNDVPPHYAIVLPAGRVNEITLVFRAEDWQATLANMAELYGPHGQPAPMLGIMADFLCEPETGCLRRSGPPEAKGPGTRLPPP